MHQNRTPPRPQPHPTAPPIPYALVLIAVAAVTGIALLCAYALAGTGHEGSVDAPDGDPYVVTPEPTAKPAPRELTLVLDLPALTDEQRYWLHVAQAIHRLPIAFGVDAPPIEFTDNEAVIVAALFYTECRLEPFWEDGSYKINEIGATGCAQLMGDLITPENAHDPNRNFYDGEAEVRRLLDANGGDIMQTLRNYKGVTTWDTTYQANSVWDYIRIGER